MNGSDSFPTQSVEIGDMVLFYDSPLNPRDGRLGWVSRRPGVNTVYILIFSEDQGFIEKPSVRHISDPGLQENAAWRQWGAWDWHPSTLLLKKLNTLMPQVVAMLARKDAKKDGQS